MFLIYYYHYNVKKYRNQQTSNPPTPLIAPDQDQEGSQLSQEFGGKSTPESSLYGNQFEVELVDSDEVIERQVSHGESEEESSDTEQTNKSEVKIEEVYEEKKEQEKKLSGAEQPQQQSHQYSKKRTKYWRSHKQKKI